MLTDPRYNQYNDEPFTIRRPESSITYIPRRFLAELSRLHDDVIDHLRGQVVVSSLSFPPLQPPSLGKLGLDRRCQSVKFTEVKLW